MQNLEAVLDSLLCEDQDSVCPWCGSWCYYDIGALVRVASVVPSPAVVSIVRLQFAQPVGRREQTGCSKLFVLILLLSVFSSKRALFLGDVSISQVVFPALSDCYYCFFCERMINTLMFHICPHLYLCVCPSIPSSIHPSILSVMQSMLAPSQHVARGGFEPVTFTFLFSKYWDYNTLIQCCSSNSGSTQPTETHRCLDFLFWPGSYCVH